MFLVFRNHAETERELLQHLTLLKFTSFHELFGSLDQLGLAGLQ